MTKHAKLLIDQLPELIGGDKPALSIEEIAVALGRNHAAVGTLIKDLHEQAAPALYIADWRRARGRHAALWKWGQGVDAAPLPHLTNAETCKKYRTSKHGRKVHLKASRRWYRQNNGAALRLADRKNKAAQLAFSKHGVAAIDPLLAAIMGANK